MLHAGMGMDYDTIDVDKLRARELKKLCKDAGIELVGSYEKRDLVKKAKEAVEILKKNPPKEDGDDGGMGAPGKVKQLQSVEEFDQFVKGGLLAVVAFIDRSQKSKEFEAMFASVAKEKMMMSFATIQAESVGNI